MIAAETGQNHARLVVQRARNLPSLGDTASRMLLATQDDNVSTAEISAILDHDMSLAAKVLKVANSAYYGRSKSVHSIGQAIVLLGISAVRSITLTASLDQMYQGGRLTPTFHVRDLWRHSLATAVCARKLATLYAPPLAEQAFLAGLLHDLGMLVSLHLNPSGFLAVLQMMEFDEHGLPERSMRLCEHETMGASHDDFGAAMLEHWQFPAQLVGAVDAHHRPMQLHAEVRALSALVHAAEHVSQSGGVAFHLEADKTPDPATLSWLNFEWEALDALGQGLRPQIIEFSRNFDS